MRSCALGFFLTPQENSIPTAETLCLSANLGRDATASGSRHDRLWDVTRTSLGRRSLKNNGFGAEGKVLHLPKYVVWAKRKR